MADPLSFVASVIAIASLAGTVATKGYQYIKAVQRCPGEVRSLIAEVNVLCGVLERLRLMLQADEAEHDGRSGCGDGGVGTVTNIALTPPDFIYECQKTLSEIEAILNKFGRASAQSMASSNKTSPSSFPNLRRLEAKDLKWPLRRSKTLQLIEALERHKSTCTLALAEDSLAGVHTILEQTKLSNQYLAELKAKQEKIFELTVTTEQEKALASMSSVNPALKLQEFRRDRQRGTGTWLFDLPEMTTWLESSDGALWIYGIPGAGKTILSTLVVDEVLSRKRSHSVGTAYFYIRHDDTESHLLSNVLGSLIAQLARQNTSALADIVELRAQHAQADLSSAALDDHELIEQLQAVSGYFEATYIMIDGLDECGPAFDRNRKRLLDALSGIHRNRSCSIHMLLFSRDELDIRKELDFMRFQMVSVAATSADLRLYVNAWLPSLEIQSEELKAEVLDTLVDEANGMFMWVRAQVDYLQRLPNDIEKQKALKRLPPTLPLTYIRIFEAIDSMYPCQTTRYVQRLLKWLVHGIDRHPQSYLLTEDVNMTVDVLSEAICLENQHEFPSQASIPIPEQLFRWLGCLVRKQTSEFGDRIVLSHFTVREFLNLTPEEVSSSTARKYLVSPGDKHDILNTCLTYLVHDRFSDQPRSTWEEIERFLWEYPLFQYATTVLCDYAWVSNYGTLNNEKGPLQSFLSMPPHPSFELWDLCSTWLSFPRYRQDVPADSEAKRNLPSPLHFAALTGFPKEVHRLLELGVDPDETCRWFSGLAPLHIAICIGIQHNFHIISGKASFFIGSFDNHKDGDDGTVDTRRERSLEVVKTLVYAGADVNQQLLMKYVDVCNNDEYRTAIVTPLTLAITCGFSGAATVLLNAGARCNAVADEEPEWQNEEDWCSIKGLLNAMPRYIDIVRHVVDLSGDTDFAKALESSAFDDSGSELRDTADEDLSSQEVFVQAYRNRDWHTLRDLVTSDQEIEVNCNDAKGESAIYCLAGEREESVLVYLLEHGADPNILTLTGHGALIKAIRKGLFKNMMSLLSFGANLEQRDPGGWTPLLQAVDGQQHEAVKVLLGRGAEIGAVLNDGTDILQIAIMRRDTDMFSSLLAHGVDSQSSDNYGTTPLHKACEAGLDFEVGKLIERAVDRMAYVNYPSLISGAPLYLAARMGFDGILERLLDAGADIDRVGPGNLLGSALMVACAEGLVETVGLLLSRGASLEVAESRFLSALETARAFSQDKVIETLEEHAIRDRSEEKV